MEGALSIVDNDLRCLHKTGRKQPAQVYSQSFYEGKN